MQASSSTQNGPSLPDRAWFIAARLAAKAAVPVGGFVGWHVGQQIDLFGYGFEVFSGAWLALMMGAAHFWIRRGWEAVSFSARRKVLTRRNAYLAMAGLMVGMTAGLSWTFIEVVPQERLQSLDPCVKEAAVKHLAWTVGQSQPQPLRTAHIAEFVSTCWWTGAKEHKQMSDEAFARDKAFVVREQMDALTRGMGR